MLPTKGLFNRAERHRQMINPEVAQKRIVDPKMQPQICWDA
jgi:hypothetical protein